MIRYFTSHINPSLPFTEYQNVSTMTTVLRKLTQEPYKPFLIHTRDYCFSPLLHSSFGKPEKLSTIFNIFYLHCSLVYGSVESSDQRKLDRDIKYFNKCWGMFVFESEPNFKVYKELQRSWVAMKIACFDGKVAEQVFEIEPDLKNDEVLKYIENVNKKLDGVKDILLVDWLKILKDL